MTPLTPDAAPETGAAMTLMQHLAELRMRIIRSALAVIAGLIVVVAFWDQMLQLLLRPYLSLCRRRGAELCGGAYDQEADTVALFILSPGEGISTRVRVALYGGIVLALPVILWQVWKFVVPALHKNEKRYALGFVTSSCLLFVAGGYIAYSTLELALEFLISWSGVAVDQSFQVSKYVDLVVFMVVAFGVGFTSPVFLVFLQVLGVVRWNTLLRGWRYAIVTIFIIAAGITPSGDPPSLLALSLPMVVLYFVAILIGWLVQRRRQHD